MSKEKGSPMKVVTGPNARENFECGTSLAETEFVSVSSSSSSSSSSDVVDKQNTQQHSSKTSVIDSIDALRNALASDTLTSDGRLSFETFTSPFETPIRMRSSSSSSSRFLQVPLVYCDQTASNRPVKSIEQYMERVCMPLYGNTHTNTSITGSQSTAFVSEARQIVAESCNAKITGKAALDLVLFAGNGCTSAVELLIDCLGIKQSIGNQQQQSTMRPVVFVGPFEHHSNLLPWRESGCEIVMVPEKDGNVDIASLQRLLSQYDDDRLKMGTFTSASNVTGKLSDVDDIAATLHRHNALAFFDYATGAPYLNMNMNPSPTDKYDDASMIAKDAIFLSPHKMLGGVGTPGVLIVKKHLVNQMNAPSRSGGGTVFYVSSEHHRFLSNRIERYEGGTPNVLGIIRTGLTFLLKRRTEQQYSWIQSQSNEAIPKTLLDNDLSTYDRVVRRLRQTAPNLVMLGDDGRNATQHIPIFSFLVRCGRRFLHYNYVCAILNDVFGIQSRGGCQCAGPYSQRLLGLTKRDATTGIDVPNEQNKEIEQALIKFKERAELLRPGFTRLSLPFKGSSSDEVEYVIKALEWVAAKGWMLMCQYTCNHRTGEWRHQSRQGKPLGRHERRWLSHYDNFQHPTTPQVALLEVGGDLKSTLDTAMSTADGLLVEASKDRNSIAKALKMNEAGLDDSMEHLRWYIYQKECAIWINEGLTIPPETESLEILGCLRPSLFGQNDAEDSAVVSDSSTTSPDNRKRKFDPAQGPSKSDTVSIDPVVFVFRDGEHMGEASLEEIEAGFDDGELSEECAIFDRESDSWVSVKEFLKDSYIATSPKEDLSAATDDQARLETVHLMQEVNKDDEIMREAVKELKKPSRDSSAWGQTTAPLLPRTAGPEAPIPTIMAQASKKGKKGGGFKPPAKMMRCITKAVFEWNMIEDGDRLLLGLSGGKDSLSLLHCLLEFKKKFPIKFDIEVCTIDPLTPSFDPSPLIPYVESLGLKYHYIRDDIVDRASKSGKGGKVVSSLCAYCARMKRGNLYTCARRNNCNKLVLAQHLDDLAESFLMSTFHNGFLRTMKAHYRINEGDLSVIRPMVYCRESLMTEFAKVASLPVINENCPACFEEPKERARVKKLLSREETLYPDLLDNIRRALIPLMHDDSTAILRSYLDETVERSKKENHLKWKKRAESKAKNDTTESVLVAVPREEPGVDHDSKRARLMLSEASEDDLVRELAKRRAEKFRLAGAMKRLEKDEEDPTDQVCTLSGGNGSIPCRELME